MNDDGYRAKRLQEVLWTNGYETLAAERRLALSVARDERPDVIVLALGPGDAGGRALAGRIFERLADYRPLVVALVDPGDPDAGNHAFGVGAHLVLTNPVDLTILTGILRRFSEVLDGVRRPQTVG
ncbi:hypothetical protein FRUB_02961 [Fimbriiglobus ruber]|uniref:Response regulatory domain-containing protein n=1 Tax=Fimbriiglobus ruber TaxID=1908690 RepID=A0A225DPN9_9BACT|nr:hypothetical protein FRUB_02961 [Fimbriiglobus ruber]